ncbi:MAG: ABC transporter ATP-binding protein [Eubacteriales bacterium]|nr:ABC transporter ATP-binding protein [Eubacteriales bacterium]
MKHLLVYMKGYRREAVLAPLFKLLEATLELLVPLVISSLIDQGIGNRDTGYVLRMCGTLIALGIVGLLFSVTAQYYSAKAATNFIKKVKYALFEHIQKLSYSEIDQHGASTMITRMTSDMNQVQTGVNLTLRLLLRSPFVVFGAMIMAFTIDKKMALIFAVMIPVLCVIVFAIMLAGIPMYRKVQKKLDDLLFITKENLEGVRVIRAFCKEDGERKRFRSQNHSLTESQLYAGRISALMNPLTYIVVNAAVIVLLYTGALRIQGGLLTQGAVVALYNYLSQILVELLKMASLVITITKSIASGNRIYEMLSDGGNEENQQNMAEKVEKSSGEDDDFIRLDHVSMSYAGAGDESLTDISFSVKKGETVGIIGGTGSGKSTLVNLLPCFYKADRGSVTIDGVDVQDYRVEELRERFGVVPQRAVLFKGTIRSNLAWGKADATDEEMMEALELAQISDYVSQEDIGLNHRVEQEGKNFSGGQRQRLTIARAFIRRPEILILDDSASALDFATDARLRKAIREMDYHPTTFIVSQRTSSIQFADKIIVLDDGRAVGIGTHEELLKTCEIYREIYASQFKEEKAS